MGKLLTITSGTTRGTAHGTTRGTARGTPPVRCHPPHRRSQKKKPADKPDTAKKNYELVLSNFIQNLQCVYNHNKTRRWAGRQRADSTSTRLRQDASIVSFVGLLFIAQNCGGVKNTSRHSTDKKHQEEPKHVDTGPRG